MGRRSQPLISRWLSGWLLLDIRRMASATAGPGLGCSVMCTWSVRTSTRPVSRMAMLPTTTAR